MKDQVKQLLNTPLKGTSIILPVMNETKALIETITRIENDCNQDITEYIIVVCSKTTSESIAICEEYQRQNPERFKLHYQTKPFLGNAIREGFALAKGTHTITMGSDLETHPKEVAPMIKLAKEHPDSIITANRWLSPGEFNDYGLLKKILNFGFQQMLRLLYFTKLSDLTFCYRLMPTKLIQAINWQETKHPFLLETIVKPLRLGVKVIEIPTCWNPRPEGETENNIFKMFAYVPVALKYRFCSCKGILPHLNSRTSGEATQIRDPENRLDPASSAGFQEVNAGFQEMSAGFQEVRAEFQNVNSQTSDTTQLNSRTSDTTQLNSRTSDTTQLNSRTSGEATQIRDPENRLDPASSAGFQEVNAGFQEVRAGFQEMSAGFQNVNSRTSVTTRLNSRTSDTTQLNSRTSDTTQLNSRTSGEATQIRDPENTKERNT